MNIYQKKLRWKFFLFLCAIAIGIGSLLYTNKLVKKLSEQERIKIELWAKATSLIPETEVDGESLLFLLSVIESNSTIPVILIDADTNILYSKNLDSTKALNKEYVEKRLYDMMQENAPIEIEYLPRKKQYLYFSKSIILSNLTYYPFVQLGVIVLFILVAYFAFSSSRKAEQNQVWVGLSKETAHQLGTPISSLLAWLELIKQSDDKGLPVEELEKDIKRLYKITERFSKIGSQPSLAVNNLIPIVENTINYLRSRSSKQIRFDIKVQNEIIDIPVNPPLFEWVIENVCKNSMDAIEGKGEIVISISENGSTVTLDIADNGKGIPKPQFKNIFKPGYTTKERGWGLGLSLTKRIIEEYHKGKIFVAGSDMGKGTTIRIVLRK